MNHEPWGVPPPPPTTDSKFYNAAQRTVVLLVEAGFDQRFWRMHCVRNCPVRHAEQGGRKAVLDELRRARSHDDAIVLAVLDADLDRIEGQLPTDPDLVWTDAHDLETTLLQLPTLEKLVAQHIDPAKLTSDEALWGETLRARLFRHAEGMGSLRWLKRRKGLDDLKFKKKKHKDLLLFDKYADCAGNEWSPSLSKVIKALLDYSSADHLLARDLAGECAALPTCESAQLCNGHDLVGFLAAWLRDRSRRKLLTAELAESLAGYCERSWLAKTSMWRAIKAWENSHPGFCVLQSDEEHGAS